MAAQIFMRLPLAARRAVGLTGSRAFRFLGLDERDFVHYEVAAPFHNQAELWQAIWEDRMPFKTHAQFCASVLGHGLCDCGAQWQKFGPDGGVVLFDLS